MGKRCKDYVGVACVNGTCPQARREEYEERGMFVPQKCDDCWMYRGCEDCALYGTEYCARDRAENWKRKRL